jgi:isopentenyl-diphosphate delta-isomerase
MEENSASVSLRKKEHIELCLTDKVSFKEKTNGFEHYDFEHYAITEVDLKKIDFTTPFFKKRISFPFLISCMTGGTKEAGSINSRLAVAANELNIPIGIGSQRQALENNLHHGTYTIIRQNAPSVPVLGNLGAAQLVMMHNFDPVQLLVDLVEADAMIIHLNPAQEILQSNGDPSFIGLLWKLEKLVKKIKIPVIVKEVGAGISKKVALRLLNVGVKGIDVAGAGGTSWSGIEILRSGNTEDNIFWDWGLPTSFCIKEVSKLKKDYKFMLIGSGGINSPFDAAKAFALGADLTSSARIILQELNNNDVEGVKKLIISWFEVIKKIMFLTGAQKLNELKNNLILKEKLF